tara:strand:+ start:852 stop:1505 length:654 start_codon:yes stop_codon:yes gene_type:complete
MTLNTQLQYKIIQRCDYKPMPWKNGLGLTLEMWRIDDDSNLRLRISQASVVENGVFSDFSGLSRTLVLLSGTGVTLEHRNSGESISNELSKVLAMACFSGGDETYATLKKGVIEDLNIMVRESDTVAKVTAGFAQTVFVLSKKTTQEKVLFTGFYANEETIVSYQEDQMHETQTLSLPAHSLLYIEQHSLSEIELISGSGILIEITTSDQNDQITEN